MSQSATLVLNSNTCSISIKKNKIQSKFFNILEGLYSIVYNKIIHNRSVKQLTMYDKFVMAHYIMTQNERTRSARR